MQTNAKCVLFTAEKINDKLLQIIKTLKKDIEFVKLFDRNVIFLEDGNSTIPIKTTFVENVFSTAVRNGKAFAAEQKLRELK